MVVFDQTAFRDDGEFTVVNQSRRGGKCFLSPQQEDSVCLTFVLLSDQKKVKTCFLMLFVCAVLSLQQTVTPKPEYQTTMSLQSTHSRINMLLQLTGQIVREDLLPDY